MDVIDVTVVWFLLTWPPAALMAFCAFFFSTGSDLSSKRFAKFLGAIALALQTLLYAPLFGYLGVSFEAGFGFWAWMLPVTTLTIIALGLGFRKPTAIQ